jgi:pheromone shutdown protein TraB
MWLTEAIIATWLLAVVNVLVGADEGGKDGREMRQKKRLQ